MYLYREIAVLRERVAKTEMRQDSRDRPSGEPSGRDLVAPVQPLGYLRHRPRPALEPNGNRRRRGLARPLGQSSVGGIGKLLTRKSSATA